MLKGYKYRLHPTATQAEFLIKTIGCTRFIYNKLLEDRIASSWIAMRSSSNLL